MLLVLTKISGPKTTHDTSNSHSFLTQDRQVLILRKITLCIQRGTACTFTIVISWPTAETTAAPQADPFFTTEQTRLYGTQNSCGYAYFRAKGCEYVYTVPTLGLTAGYFPD